MHTIAIGGCMAGQFINGEGDHEGAVCARYKVGYVGPQAPTSRDIMNMSVDMSRTLYILKRMSYAENKTKRDFWLWVDTRLLEKGSMIDVWEHILNSYRAVESQ